MPGCDEERESPRRSQTPHAAVRAGAGTVLDPATLTGAVSTQGDPRAAGVTLESLTGKQ